MADTRIVYPLDNYLGAALAEAVRAFDEARYRLHQFQDMVNAIGDAPDVETAMGMAQGAYNAYNMQMIVNGTLTSLDAVAPGMAKLDKGL